MNIKDTIFSLQIFAKYYDDPSHQWPDAFHEELRIPNTDAILSAEDLEEVIKLGWWQDVDTDGKDYSSEYYTPSEGWVTWM